ATTIPPVATAVSGSTARDFKIRQTACWRSTTTPPAATTLPSATLRAPILTPPTSTSPPLSAPAQWSVRGTPSCSEVRWAAGPMAPEDVTWDNNGRDAQGVDYSRLTALLIEATKEQQSLIHEQQEQIARLALQIKTIQASLEESGQSDPKVRTAFSALY